MFTGIIRDVGTVRGIAKTKSGKRLSVATKLADVAPGDSVAVNGVCLTALEGEGLAFDVVPESLSRSNIGKLRKGARVNLETALRAGDPIGGHFVTGHIDGTGTVRGVARRRGVVLRVGVAPAMTKLMIPKGSVAIDGVSLTLVDVGRDYFTVALIPFTLQNSTLGHAKTGDTLNIEADMLGKYVLKSQGKLSRDLLSRAGFLK
ncbi:MAG: riboflavin synthase [Planctomycetota bacterium]